MKALQQSLCFFFIIATFSSYAQSIDCDCKTDLEFLHKKIKKTPAYKQNKEAYKIAYKDILEKVETNQNLYECHQLVNQLLLSINDNHSRVYGLNNGASKAIRNNESRLDSFMNTEFAHVYPVWTLDLDSLENILIRKPILDIEGIYTYDTLFKIAVFKNEFKDFYHAVILESKSPLWQRGEESHTLTPFGKDYFLAVGGNLSSKRLLTYTEQLRDGSFQFLAFSKQPDYENRASQFPSKETYYKKEISDEITYIRVGSFSSWYPTLGEAETFYASLKDSLNKEHLIVDLRNNTGGGDRNSDILYKILKKFAKKHQIYVLTNFRTMSNGEQFTLRLRKLDNCVHLGQKTNGCLAYEIKDSSYELPSGHFIAVLTKNKFKKYLKYESQGVVPDYELNNEEDWIAQIQRFIENR